MVPVALLVLWNSKIKISTNVTNIKVKKWQVSDEPATLSGLQNEYSKYWISPDWSGVTSLNKAINKITEIGLESSIPTTVPLYQWTGSIRKEIQKMMQF